MGTPSRSTRGTLPCILVSAFFLVQLFAVLFLRSRWHPSSIGGGEGRGGEHEPPVGRSRRQSRLASHSFAADNKRQDGGGGLQLEAPVPPSFSSVESPSAMNNASSLPTQQHRGQTPPLHRGSDSGWRSPSQLPRRRPRGWSCFDPTLQRATSEATTSRRFEQEFHGNSAPAHFGIFVLLHTEGGRDGGRESDQGRLHLPATRPLRWNVKRKPDRRGVAPGG